MLTLIRVRLDAGLDVLGDVRAFVSAYCVARYGAIVAESLVLSSHELLENAVTHGSLAAAIDFKFCEDEDGGALYVEVTNTAQPSRIERLTQRLSDIRDKGAQQVYLSALREMMKSERNHGMLGLARLAHEAKVTLGMRAHESRVLVTATTQSRRTAARRRV